MPFNVAFAVLGTVAFTYAQVVDNTLTPMARGRDVVEAVLDKITRSEIFPDDRDFLRRIAYVESLFGNHQDTYRSGYNGGIWQVDLSKFESTRISQRTGSSSAMERIRAGVLEKFGIDWTKVRWEDLQKPFYSGLAAGIFFAAQTKEIPEDLLGQAEHWKAFYDRPAVKRTVEHFMNLVEQLDGVDAMNSGGAIDLTLVIDGSGSIGSLHFKSAKIAISSMVGTFNELEAFIGVILYSTAIDYELGFNTTSSTDELVGKINGLSYPDEGTNTHLGMMAAVHMYDDLGGRREPGIPRVMLVFTDGQSNDPAAVVRAAAEAARANITTISIGIGSTIKTEELLRIANNVTKNVIRTQDYETLKLRIFRIAFHAKKVPKTPPIGAVQKEAFTNADEKRYFEYPLPPNGITVELNATGAIRGFYSYTVEHPSSALYDGILNAGKTFIPAPSAKGLRQGVNDTMSAGVPSRMPSVHLTVESQEANTTATMDTEGGDTTGGGASTIAASTAAALLPLLAMLIFHQ